MLVYHHYISEKGEFAAVRMMQGPKIPEVERELTSTRVITPAFRGSEAVPCWVAIEIGIP
jgi:hypothetical protein